jgi:sugar-specific transcriptional regulator TrmB/DNA-binding CsgD family transcriptional regulator
MLASFGLSPVAEAVYQVMLSHPRLRDAGIAEELELPQEQVHRALEELSRVSLVRSSFEDPGALRAVPPQVGLAALVASEEQDLRERQERFNATKLTLERVIDEYLDESRKRPYEGVEQLVGLDSIRNRIESLAAGCEAEIIGFAPDGPQTPENMEASKPVDSAALDRGVRMRTIYLDSLTHDTASMSYVNWLITQGAEVRTHATLPNRMIIYDRRFALLPMNPDDSAAGAVLLRGAGVVTALCELFEQMWSSARIIGPGREQGDQHLAAEEPSDQERAVLQLLSQGCTDEVIARKLGVSVRTSRRITASLLARLESRSRFQAGAQAVISGLLSTDSGRPSDYSGRGEPGERG